MSNISRRERLISTIVTRKFIRRFIIFSGIIFCITGVVKVFSAFGSAHILSFPDPLLGLSFGKLIFATGIIELIVSIICLIGKSIKVQMFSILCLTISIWLYRVGLLLIGWHKPCKCLGSLTDWIGISPSLSDWIMKFLLSVLITTSCGIIFGLRNGSINTELS